MKICTPDICDNNPEDVRICEPMFVNYGGKEAFWGKIVTIKCHEDNSLVKENASKPGDGQVMVVDGGGSLRRALLGDMIAESAVLNGWTGIIIYGCVRDVDALEKLDFGVQALAAIPLKTQKRGIGEVNIPVTFGGVTFNPGGYIYADNNGIVVSDIELKI